MKLRREFEKLIEKKRVEIEEAKRTIASAEAYIQAMNDAIKKLPKEDVVPVVRKGSEVERIRDLIVAAGQPLHLNEIVEGLGRAADPDAKAKVAGILGWYTTKGKVFSKTAPNTYGLAEPNSSSSSISPADLPEGFGGDNPADDPSEVLPGEEE